MILEEDKNYFFPHNNFFDKKKNNLSNNFKLETLKTNT